MRRLVAALGILAALSGVAFAGSNLFFFVGSAGGPAPTACAVGAIDLSLSTGCNLPFYLGGIFP